MKAPPQVITTLAQQNNTQTTINVDKEYIDFLDNNYGNNGQDGKGHGKEGCGNSSLATGKEGCGNSSLATTVVVRTF